VGPQPRPARETLQAVQAVPRRVQRRHRVRRRPPREPVAPWYTFNIIELLCANLIDELVGKVTPKNATSGGAKLLERVVNEYRQEDEFSSKQVPFVKQAS
jgi:hypothetical protein